MFWDITYVGLYGYSVIPEYYITYVCPHTVYFRDNKALYVGPGTVPIFPGYCSYCTVCGPGYSIFQDSKKKLSIFPVYCNTVGTMYARGFVYFRDITVLCVGPG